MPKKWAWIAQVLASLAVILGMVAAARQLIQLHIWEALPSLGVTLLGAAVNAAVVYTQLTRRAS